VRLLALDFGDKTLGVAVGDTNERVASGLTTIRRKHAKKIRQTLSSVAELADLYRTEAFVLGLPLNMDGTPGVRTEITLSFAKELTRRTGLNVLLQDERLSSLEALALMREAGFDREKCRQRVDEFAAVVILRDFFNKGAYGNNTVL